MQVDGKRCCILFRIESAYLVYLRPHLSILLLMKNLKVLYHTRTAICIMFVVYLLLAALFNNLDDSFIGLFEKKKWYVCITHEIHRDEWIQ